MFFYFFRGHKRSRTACILAISMLFMFFHYDCEEVRAEENTLSLYAASAVLMDADSGRVLYEKDSEHFLANASTTKIMTCILALENADMEDTVTVSSCAAGMPKVKLYMKEGEHFLLKDLLYSMMLESHNDSAMAIAEHVGGSMDGFAQMMNKKAEEIGCRNTYFITPNGLDATKTVTGKDGMEENFCHGTTAADLARIMAYCTFHSPMREAFIQITQTAQYSFCSEEGRSFSCVNHNAFLNMMEGAVSGKTGFTNKAGYCYVGALERDGKRFTIALLACGWPNHKTYKWADAKALFGYGINNYEYHTLSEVSYSESLLSPIPVTNGAGDRIGETVYEQVMVKTGIPEGSHLGCDTENLMKKDEIGILLKKGEKIEIQCRVEKCLTAPVSQGTAVGTIRYMAGDRCLYSEEIVTLNHVKKIDFGWCLYRILDIFLLNYR